MSSARTIRDPVLDHLITPQNSAMTIIDFQPLQVSSVTSRDKETLVRNVVSMATVGKLFGLPVVLSTVNVKTGINKPMIKPITDVFPIHRADRPHRDKRLGRRGFRPGGQGSGPQKAHHSGARDGNPCASRVDALREGYDIFPVVDA